AILSRAAIIVIGLPDWVFPGSLIVMALALPVILFTGLVRHQAKIARMQSTLTPGGNVATHGTMAQIALKASPWMTWRRTAMGGAWSVGIFTLMVGAWMVLRAPGMATREGIKATVDGQVLALGGSRVIQANLIATQTGEVLASFKETAKTENDIVNAIDQLARDLRERVGESLRNIHASPPYE